MRTLKAEIETAGKAIAACGGRKDVMKIVPINKRECEIPTDWREGEEMLTHVMGPYFDKRGGNVERMSCAARVAFAFFAEHFMAPDPTAALIFLMMEICKRRGAGLDGLEKARRWHSIEEEEKQA
jgi:hypothetical protein